MDKVVDAIVIFVALFILDLWKFVNEAVDESERYMFYINYAIFKPSRLIPQVPKKKNDKRANVFTQACIQHSRCRAKGDIFSSWCSEPRDRVTKHSSEAFPDD